MSFQQLPQSQSAPSAHQIPSKHNITLGPEQTDRKSISNHNPLQSFSQNYDIHLELKNISREVTRIAERADKTRGYGPSSPMASSLPLYQQNPSPQLEKDPSSFPHPHPNASTLSKYNYYGREYRFSTQNPVQKAQKPNDAHFPPSDEEPNSFSPTTKHHPQKQQLNLPDSKSYYIYFEQPKRQKQLNLKVPQIQSKHSIPHHINPSLKDKQALYGSLNYPKNTHPSHFPQDYDDQARTPPLQVFSKQQAESKWVLEKKVQRLEKELHEMKKKQQQRQKLRNFTTNNSKKDSKVFVGKQVDQFINSLWP